MAGKGRPPISKDEPCKIVTISIPISHDKALEVLAKIACRSKAELIRDCIVSKYGLFLDAMAQSIAGEPFK
jgi:hypothetical protein